MPSKSLPRLLEDLLLAFDLQVNEVANMVGVTARTVTRWKRGKSKPLEENLRNLIRAFHCSSLDDLERKVDGTLKAKRLGSYTDIAGDIESLQGLQKEVFLIEFIQEPGKERRGTMLDYPTLWEKREEIRNAHARNMESAEVLFRSVLRVEENLG